MNITGAMEITTVIGCPIDCYYCPQDKLKTAYGNGNRPRIMTFEDFQICIDKLPSTVRIDFSGMAEPWLNPQCTDMVLYASEKGHPLAIYTTLVGMNEQDWKRIKSLSYQIFNIHVADTLKKSRIPVNPTYKKLLQQILSDGIKGTLEFCAHSESHPEIRHIVTSAGILPHDRAGNIEGVKHSYKTGPIQCKSCGYLINRNVLLPDGTVVLCCMDYGLQHPLGNLKEQSYEAILHGDKAQSIRKAMVKSNNIICRSCVNSESVSVRHRFIRLFDSLWAARRVKRWLCT